MAKQILISALLGIALGAPLALGAEPLGQGQLWLISTRLLPCYDDAQAPVYWKWSGCDWVPADEAAYLAADDPAVPTTFYVHGNRSDAQDAVDSGWRVWCQLQTCTTRPFRLVIWSWPSDRIRGALLDARVKACRSDVDSFYLARLLNRTHPQVPINLLGYSFGTRVVGGALQLAAGGSLCGQTIAAVPLPGRRPMRAMLLAAAEDSDWLLPGHRDGMATNQVDRVLITVNSRDPVLKRYPLLYHVGGPQALGFVGPEDGSRCGKLQVIDVTCAVGREHSWDGYFAATEFLGLLPWYAHLQDSDARTARVF
jgi:hypothetical protein